MASMETSRRLVRSQTGSIPACRGVPAWKFQRSLHLRNHDAGSARRPVPKESMMRFYHQQHRFCCGVDLHARSMFFHILDAQGQTR